jgi:hypothetical protein
MINHALIQMESDDEELYDIGNPIEVQDTDVGGGCFHILWVKQDSDRNRKEACSCTILMGDLQ